MALPLRSWATQRLGELDAEGDAETLADLVVTLVELGDRERAEAELRAYLGGATAAFVRETWNRHEGTMARGDALQRMAELARMVERLQQMQGVSAVDRAQLVADIGEVEARLTWVLKKKTT